MIRISLGSVGSGKTANEVRELILNRARRKTFTNIMMKRPQDTKNVMLLNQDMIIKKDLVSTKVNRKTGEETPVYDLKLNMEFWKSIKEPINVILDEAHTILNSRRSMSKVNVIMGDWLALIRRVLGAADSGMGELVFITQLHNRIDTIAREMALQIRYHVCHFCKSCQGCGYGWRENSETAEPLWTCPDCGSYEVKKHSHQIQVWHFKSMGHYLQWKMLGENTYHACYVVTDIEKYFPFYDTLQWDNMFSEYY
jgi:hypothetical protein